MREEEEEEEALQPTRNILQNDLQFTIDYFVRLSRLALFQYIFR